MYRTPKAKGAGCGRVGARRVLCTLSVLAFAGGAAFAAAMDGGGAPPATVTVSFLSETGPVKPMNAVNNGPKGGSENADHCNFVEFRAANIPYGRTHDASEYICYGGDHCVDISAVFPDFNADENDPKNYDFPVTDTYLRDMRSAGTEPFYRLGQRIEHAAKRYNIYPPADYAKWARICEHVIRHYNEGWADGFRWDIKYWEIWNEADIDWKWKGPPRTWGGTPEQFFEFFEIAAKHLKGKFPHLKIGGPACGGNTAWSEMFFAHQRKNGTPMDFFSWHLYHTEPGALAAKARAVRQQMAKYGYGGIESILDEWNYVKNWGSGYHHSVMALTSHKGAAFVAATMIACNAEPVDMLMYYDAKPSAHMNGMFDQVTLMPLKAYYAIYGWGQMSACCDRAVKTTSDASDIYAVAAKGANGKRMIFLTRYSDDDNVANLRQVTIRLVDGGTFPEKVVTHVTDYARNYSELKMRPGNPYELRFRMPPCSFTMIEYDAPSDRENSNRSK